MSCGCIGSKPPHLCAVHGDVSEPGSGSWRTHQRAYLRKRQRGAEPVTKLRPESAPRTLPQATHPDPASKPVQLPEPEDRPGERRDMQVCCRECKTQFTFDVAEQELFVTKGWPIPRQRCEPCTERRKLSKRKK